MNWPESFSRRSLVKGIAYAGAALGLAAVTSRIGYDSGYKNGYHNAMQPTISSPVMQSSILGTIAESNAVQIPFVEDGRRFLLQSAVYRVGSEEASVVLLGNGKLVLPEGFTAEFDYEATVGGLEPQLLLRYSGVKQMEFAGDSEMQALLQSIQGLVLNIKK